MPATHFQDGQDWEAILRQLLPRLRTRRAGALDTTDAYLGTANEDVPSAGMVVALIGETFELCDVETGQVCGVAIEPTTLGSSIHYVTRGFVFAESWLLVTDSVRLEPGRKYFLYGRGKLSLVPPVSGYCIPIGQAQTEHIFDVSIGTKIRL